MSIIARRSRKRHVPMAGIDDVIASINRLLNVPTKSQECLATANAKVATLDARIMDLDKTWHPTGFYTPEQMLGVITQVQGFLRQGSSILDQQLAEPTAEGDRDAIAIEKGAIARKMNDSLVFVRAAGDAQTRGISVIDSPGFRRWVITSMQVGRDAVTAAAFVSCMRPWFVTALAVFQIYFDAVWNLAKAMVNVAVAIGEQVLTIPDTISTLWTYAKWGAVIFGGWWAFEHGPDAYRRLKKAL